MVDFNATPVVGGIPTANFGESGKWWTGTHSGKDYAAPTGTPILAVAAGEVTQSGWFSGVYGNMVTVRHSASLETRYAHATRVAASVGDRVNAGEIIAFVGATGNTTGSHVHLEVLDDGTAVNPDDYLGEFVPSSGSPDVSGLDASAVPSADELGSGAARIGIFVGGAALVGVAAYFGLKGSGVL